MAQLDRYRALSNSALPEVQNFRTLLEKAYALMESLRDRSEKAYDIIDGLRDELDAANDTITVSANVIRALAGPCINYIEIDQDQASDVDSVDDF